MPGSYPVRLVTGLALFAHARRERLLCEHAEGSEGACVGCRLCLGLVGGRLGSSCCVGCARATYQQRTDTERGVSPNPERRRGDGRGILHPRTADGTASSVKRSKYRLRSCLLPASPLLLRVSSLTRPNPTTNCCSMYEYVYLVCTVRYHRA